MNSDVLRNFYSKALESYSVDSVILLYDNLANTMSVIMDYLGTTLDDYRVESVAGSTGLEKLLTMYDFARTRLTDFGYDVDFVNSMMVDLAEMNPTNFNARDE